MKYTGTTSKMRLGAFCGSFYAHVSVYKTYLIHCHCQLIHFIKILKKYLKMSMNRGVGGGSSSSLLVKFLHSHKLLQEVYPNITKHQRKDNLIIIREETRVVNRKRQQCIILRSKNKTFENKELFLRR